MVPQQYAPSTSSKFGGIKKLRERGMQGGMGDVVSEHIKTNVSYDTSTHQGEHLCQIILKSTHKSRSYGLDNINKFMTFYHLTFMCDLDLQPTQINVSNGTTTPQGEHLYKIILKSMHKCRSYGPDNLIYVTFKCDLDLQPTYM